MSGGVNIELSWPTVHQDILTEAGKLMVGAEALNRGFARLAGLMAAFKQTEGWREYAYPSFNHFILFLSEQYRLKPRTLYQHIAIAEKLLPLVGAAGLDKMGVSKALEVTYAARRAQSPVRPELLEAAMDEKNGRSEIRALAHRLYELKPGEQVKGTYVDLGGFYMDDEQYKSFTEGVDLTCTLLQLPKEMPQWLRFQKCILAWIQEFSGTYSSEVYGVAELPPANEESNEHGNHAL
jgi:hypothetical protein